MKSYDIQKVYFKFRIGNIVIQFRRLLMTSDPKGITYVFTASTDVKSNITGHVADRGSNGHD